jgi:hypothetical protein
VELNREFKLGKCECIEGYMEHNDLTCLRKNFQLLSIRMPLKLFNM